MAAIIGKYEEGLSTDNVLKMTRDNIQIKVSFLFNTF
jgi:hypothetical protein